MSMYFLAPGEIFEILLIIQAWRKLEKLRVTKMENVNTYSYRVLDNHCTPLIEDVGPEGGLDFEAEDDHDGEAEDDAHLQRALVFNPGDQLAERNWQEQLADVVEKDENHSG